jgi:hypothetical protein
MGRLQAQDGGHQNTPHATVYVKKRSVYALSERCKKTRQPSLPASRAEVFLHGSAPNHCGPYLSCAGGAR